MILLLTTFIYSIALYGLILLLVNFSGPFNIMGIFRVIMGAIHPELGKLLSCPYCTSFWVSGILSALNYFFLPIKITPFNILYGNTEYWWLVILFDIFYGSAIVWLLHVLDDFLGTNIKVEYEDE